MSLYARSVRSIRPNHRKVVSILISQQPYRLPSSWFGRISRIDRSRSQHSFTRRPMQSKASVEEAGQSSAPQLEYSKRTYERDALLNQYLGLHYGPVELVYPKPFWHSEVGWLRACLNFPKKIAQLTYRYPNTVIGTLSMCKGNANRARLSRVATERQLPVNSALDLGCAVGASSFELATIYKQVVGIDISSRFIEAAKEMQSARRVPYLLQVEGDITQPAVAELTAEADPSRVTFLQGDACKLADMGLGTFDAVLMANLICRLPNPRLCLEQVTECLNPGGLLVLTSPFTWMEQYTPREHWIGAAAQVDATVASASALVELMAPNFDLISQTEIPVVIREHSRKYQFILPTMFVWQKKGGAAAPVTYNPASIYGRDPSARKDLGSGSGLWLPSSAQKPGPRPS